MSNDLSTNNICDDELQRPKPSIRPDISFRRFLSDNFDDKPLPKEAVIYTTTGGWQIKFADLAWFKSHPLTVKHPNKLKVLLKMGDELLNAHASCQFYQDKEAFVLAQDGTTILVMIGVKFCKY